MWQKCPPFWCIIGAGLAIRLFLTLIGLRDYWGDAYHNFMMERDILQSGFTDYYDIKNRHVVWLPLFRFLGAFFMGITQADSLQTMHFLGSLLFVISWFPIYQLFRDKNTDFSIEKVALLVLLPLPVLFSVYHLAEILSFTIMIFLIWAIHKNYKYVLFLLSVLTVLTRHEATFLLGLITLGLLLEPTKRKQVGLIVLGVLVGLGLWSFWVYTQTGHPFSWFMARVQASSAGADSAKAVTGWHWRFLEVLFSIAVAFPFVLFVKRKWDWKASGLIYLISFLIAGNFLFHSADAKYLLVSIPVLVYSLDSTLLQKHKKGLFRSLAVLNLMVIPIFFVRSYNLEHERVAGKFLASLPESVIFNDHPVSIYTSQFKHKTFSSEMLTSLMKERNQDLFTVMQAEGIRYLVYYESDRSLLHNQFSNALNKGAIVDFGPFTLTCIYITDLKEVTLSESKLFSDFLNRIYGKWNPVLLFEITDELKTPF